MWDPIIYSNFRDARNQPFYDLINQVSFLLQKEPNTIVDLGCGIGDLTAILSKKWPNSRVYGIDNSNSMLESAKQYANNDKLKFELEDISIWSSDNLVDLLISNAALQWVPSHEECIPNLAKHVLYMVFLRFKCRLIMVILILLL